MAYMHMMYGNSSFTNEIQFCCVEVEIAPILISLSNQTSPIADTSLCSVCSYRHASNAMYVTWCDSDLIEENKTKRNELQNENRTIISDNGLSFYYFKNSHCFHSKQTTFINVCERIRENFGASKNCVHIKLLKRLLNKLVVSFDIVPSFMYGVCMHCT